MPKKFKGENTKAVDAKARKAAIQHETAEKRQREAEDALWADDDKSLAKKTQRKVVNGSLLSSSILRRFIGAQFLRYITCFVREKFKPLNKAVQIGRPIEVTLEKTEINVLQNNCYFDHFDITECSSSIFILSLESHPL